MTNSQGELEGFWDSLDRELVAAPLDLTLEPDAFYSQPEWSVYRMNYTGLDGYRLFAWLSVPRDNQSGNWPALLRMPDYGSVHDLIYTSLRHDAIVMNPTYRGQRHSDAKFQAEYPGLLTQGIGRRETFVMLRVFADALCSLQALLAQDQGRVDDVAVAGAGLGGALALAVAARRPQVKAVAADTPLALGHPGVLEAASAYPLAELNDYLRVRPHHRDAILANSAHLNPVKVAAQVTAPVLLSLGRRDRGQCPLAIGAEIAANLRNCDLRVYDGAGEGGGHPHGVLRGAWLQEQLGLD